MADIYEKALKKLAADERSLNEIGRESDISASTLRDIKSGRIKSPRFVLLKKLADYYEKAA